MKKNIIKIGEKRIFAPSFIFVQNGNAEKLVQGISEKQKSFNSDLTEEIIEDEKEIFDNFYSNTTLCLDILYLNTLWREYFL